MDNATQQDIPPLPRSDARREKTAPGFKIGILKGKLGEPPDFLEPMDADELNRWEGGV